MNKPKKQLNRTIWSANSHWQFNVLPIAILCVSLLVFGFGEGMMVQAALGSSPWTVLAQGVSLKTGANIGVCTFLISVAVMITWLPLKQKLGLGTVLNVALIALGLGVSVNILPQPDSMVARIFFSISGIVLIGMMSAFYLTCHMGAGPRDGLMVGIFERTGWRIGMIRTLIEGAVCLLGWLLGGIVGVSTLLFAFGVGWVLQFGLVWINRYFSEK